MDIRQRHISYKGCLLTQDRRFLDALELLYILYGAKPLCRQICSKERLLRLMRLCKEIGLQLSTRYKIISLEKRDFSNAGRYLPLDAHHGDFIVFISKDKDLARHASKTSLIETKELGVLLGYPDCCVDFYMDMKKTAERTNYDYTLLSSRSGLVESYLTNYCLRSAGTALLCHFPCSLACDQSLALGRRYQDILEEHAKDISKSFIEDLKGCVIYSHDHGIHHSSSCHIKGTTITAGPFRSTKESLLSKALARERSLIYESLNTLRLGADTFSGDDLAIFIFE